MTTVKRIFISIPWFTPAYKAGGPIQSILNLVSIPQEGVEYFVFTSNRDLNNEKLEQIAANNWYQFNEDTKVFYSKRVGRSDVLMAQVKLVQPDVIYAIGIFDWHFNITPIFFCRAKKKILSVRGMLHTGALQQKALKKNLFLAFIKLMGLKHLTEFHATDKFEAELIKQEMGKKAVVHIAQNFPRIFSGSSKTHKALGKLDLVSICLISKMKNILLVLESLQYCEQEINYHIYGVVKDAEYWQQCEAAMQNLPVNITVHYHAALAPSKVEAVLKDMQVFIQPSESENYGHSIVEALSAGLPVITSNNTPWDGLKAAKAGENVPLNQAALCKSIDFFAMMDTAEYQEWSNAAAAYIRNRIDLEEINQQHLNMFAIDE